MSGTEADQRREAAEGMAADVTDSELKRRFLDLADQADAPFPGPSAPEV